MAISSPEMMLVPGVVRCRNQTVECHLYTKVDITKTTATDLAANPVFVPHAEVLHHVSDAFTGIAERV